MTPPAFVYPLVRLHNTVFHTLGRALDGWFTGLFARFVFAAVLFTYFLNSAFTKVGDGLFGIFQIQDGAYFQILPPIVEQYGYDASQIPFFPWDLIVLAGTYGEILLPIMVVLGLFTRIASIGMIIFIAVQSYVDIAFHGADEATIGVLFDRLPNAVIMDQRLLWIFPLIYLIVKGPGLISLDTLLGRWMNGATKDASDSDAARMA